MLQMILDALAENLGPQVAPHVNPQVAALLRALQGEMSRADLQAVLGLSDRKSFQQRYLQPALAAGLIEHTLPDKPNSRFQKYRVTGRGTAAGINMPGNADPNH